MADQNTQDAGQATGQPTGQNSGLDAGQGPGHGPGAPLSHGSPSSASSASSPGSLEGARGPEGSTAGGDHPEGEPVSGTAAGAAAVAAPWYTSAAPWVTILLLLALAATLGWLAWQKHAAEQLVRDRHDQEQARLKQHNDEREAYLNELRALLELDPCDIARALAGIRPPAGRNLPVLPDGLRGTGTAANTPAHTPAQTPVQTPADAPSAESAAGQPSSQPSGPASGTNAQGRTADEALNGPEAREPANIAELLEQNTVLILAAQDRGVSMGTGFFLSPDTIMTNAHVVGTASEAVYINKFVGSVRAARVLMRTRDNGLDFAVLRTGEPVPVKPLQLQKSTVQRMEKVSAWGFPAAVTGDDPKFMGLLRGNAEAAPEVVYTEGTVSVVLDKSPPVIVHTATVSQGNSGGPLVNGQGEVVGINTMIKLDDKSYRQSSLAIPSSVMARFLEANGLPFTMAPEAANDDGANAGGGAKQ